MELVGLFPSGNNIAPGRLLQFLRIAIRSAQPTKSASLCGLASRRKSLLNPTLSANAAILRFGRGTLEQRAQGFPGAADRDADNERVRFRPRQRW